MIASASVAVSAVKRTPPVSSTRQCCSGTAERSIRPGDGSASLLRQRRPRRSRLRRKYFNASPVAAGFCASDIAALIAFAAWSALARSTPSFSFNVAPSTVSNVLWMSAFGTIDTLSPSSIAAVRI